MNSGKKFAKRKKDNIDEKSKSLWNFAHSVVNMHGATSCHRLSYCVHVQNLSTVTIIYVLLYVLTLHVAFVIFFSLSWALDRNQLSLRQRIS